jgi:hypothetical protein
MFMRARGVRRASKDQGQGTAAPVVRTLSTVMRHELFAILDTADAVDAALRDIRSRPLLKGKYSVVLHRDGITQAASDPILAHEERGTREGARFGAVLGAVGGAAGLALLEAPFEFVGAGPALAAVIGGVAGGTLGAFVGTIAGSSYGDTHLQRLASRLRKGQVLMSVNVAGRARTNEIEEILRRHGADTTRRVAF